MAEWDTIIEDPAFQDLPPAGQQEIRRSWFDSTVLPDLRAAKLPDEVINEERNNALKEFDNGQGYVSSALNSAAQGFLKTGTTALQGAGAMVGSDGLEETALELEASVDDTFSNNPSMGKTNFVGNALGNAGSFIATMGAGGLAAKGLGLAAKTGTVAGGLGTGGLAGFGGGVREADYYGITGEDRYLRGLAGAAVEVGSELILPGGMGSELSALSRIPGFGDLAGTATRTGALRKAIATEAVEEEFAQVGGNAATQILQEEGGPVPTLTQGSVEAMLGGAIGGVAFGFMAPVRKSDTVAAAAEEAAVVNDDPEAAEIIANARVATVGKTVPVEDVKVDARPEGDVTLGDLLTDVEVDKTPLTSEDLPNIEAPPEVPGLVTTPAAGDGIVTPEAVSEVAPVVPEETPEATPEVTPITPEEFAEEPVLTPEQEQTQREWERRLIDRKDRVSVDTAVKMFNALKALGATRAKLVVNNTGWEEEGGPTKNYRGSHVTKDGEETVYINEGNVTWDTPVHEIGHSFIPEMKTTNPGLYAQGQALVEGAAKPLMEAIQQRYARHGHDLSGDELLHETLTTLYGNESADFWGRYVGNPGVVQQIQQWIAKVREWVRQHLGSKGIDPDMSMAEFAKKVNRQILAGKMKAGGGSGASLTGESGTDAAPQPGRAPELVLERPVQPQRTHRLGNRTFSNLNDARDHMRELSETMTREFVADNLQALPTPLDAQWNRTSSENATQWEVIDLDGVSHTFDDQVNAREWLRAERFDAMHNAFNLTPDGLTMFDRNSRVVKEVIEDKSGEIGESSSTETPFAEQEMAQMEGVADTLLGYAKFGDFFQFGKTESKSAADIAEAVSTPNKTIKTKEGPGGVLFMGRNGYLTIEDATSDRPYISATGAGSQGNQSGGGSQLYAAALDWIHNNGKRVRNDPGGLTKINERRRTSNMLASALRWGTTKHLAPNPQQGLPQWALNNDKVNIAAMALKEASWLDAIPGIEGWKFNFDNATFEDEDGNPIIQFDLEQAVRSGNPTQSGVGISTLQRGLLAKSTLSELQRGKSAESLVAAELPGSLQRVSYSINDDAYIAAMQRGDVSAAQALVDSGDVRMNRNIFDALEVRPEATQIGTTIHRRLKDAGIISDADFANGKGLVYGDGKGAASADLGADSYEPFPPSGFNPDFKGDRSSGKGDDIPKKYDTVLNTFVLNVVDPETRDFIVKDIAGLLNDGGRAVIVTRGNDVLNSKPLQDFGEMARLQKKGSALTYQKGFTQKELVSYLQETLGDGYAVRPVKGGSASDVRAEFVKQPAQDGGAQFSINDDAYMAAVESGDVAKQQQMVDAAAKAAGYNVGPVYHGTNAEFNEFKPTTEFASGAYMFSPDEDYSFIRKSKFARRFFLRLNNPVNAPFQWAEGVAYQKDAVDQDRREGRDGLIYEGDKTQWKSSPEYYTQIAVYSPEQIKSADPVTRDDAGNVIPLSQRFQRTSPDIRFSINDDALDTAARSIKTDNRAMRILLDSEAESGPMDGGCLICARALIKAAGEGSLVRLSNAGQTEHYGASIGGVIYDGDGGHASGGEWAKDFSEAENFKKPLTVEEGFDATSEIPDDPAAVDKLTKVLRRKMDAGGTRFSINPTPVRKRSGVAKNKPGSLVRDITEKLYYDKQTNKDALIQAAELYEDNKNFTFAEHLQELKDLVSVKGEEYLNATPGAYFGLISRDISNYMDDPSLSESEREQAEEELTELYQVVKAAGAAGGQFIQGFDQGLKIANNPRMEVKTWENGVPFDQNTKRQEEFDEEKAVVTKELDELAAEAVKNADPGKAQTTVDQLVGDVIKGEGASDVGAAVLDETLGKEIAAVEATDLPPWFQEGISGLNKRLQTDIDEWLALIEARSILMAQEGDASLTPAERNARALEILGEMSGTKTEQLAEVEKRIAAKLKKLRLKPVTPKADKPASEDDLHGMVVGRLTERLNGLLSATAKQTPKITQQKIAEAISSAMLSKAGYAGVPATGDLATALGLLLANQEVAASALQQIHTMLESDPSTQGAITREKLKAFMQLAIGKTFDTAEGASKDAAPYGEEQIAAVLRDELRRADANLTKIIKDAAMVRDTGAKLEAQLRDPKRGLEKLLGEKGLNDLVNTVLAEYNKTAAQRAESFRRDAERRDAEENVRQRMQDEKKAAERFEKETLAAEKKIREDASKQVRDALTAEKKAEDQWKAEQSAANDRVRKDAEREVRKAMEAERKAEERWKAEQKASAERVRKAAEKQVRDAMAAEQRDAAKWEREQRQAFVRRRRQDRKNRRNAGMDPEALNEQEKADLLAVPGEKIIDYLARQFGFDLKGVTSIARMEDRTRTVKAMTLKLADALGLSTAQAEKFSGEVVAQAMKTVDANRKKQVERKISDAVKALNGRRMKSKGPLTEAQRLIRLAETGGLTAENIEQVMLKNIDAKKFTPEFRAKLEALLEKANDPHLPAFERGIFYARFIAEIQSARGISAIGLWGEFLMSNIFFSINTFKVNYLFGGIKALADAGVMIMNAPSYVGKTEDNKRVKGLTRALAKRYFRGYAPVHQYHSKYILNTGRSMLTEDATTQFSSSLMELLAVMPETEIRAWQNGKPLSPFWQKAARVVLTSANRYVRRIMVGTDIYHRTPAVELLKQRAVVKALVEKGGRLPSSSAEWNRIIDEAMYGMPWEDAVKEANRIADEAVADGRVTPESRGLFFGETLDNMMNDTLGLDPRILNNQKQEEGKRVTAANPVEGIFGALSNILVNAAQNIPGFSFQMPAIRTPINFFTQSLDWTPWGYMRAWAVDWNNGKSTSVTNALFNREGQFRQWNLPEGGAPEGAVAEFRIKATIGTSAMLLLGMALKADMDDDDDKAFFYITGKGPENPMVNKLWREKGFRPFAMRIGGKWLAYQEMPGFAAFAWLGAVSDTYRYGKDDETNTQKLTYAFYRTAGSFGDAAVLRSLQTTISSINGTNQGASTSLEKAEQTAGNLASLALWPRIGREVNEIIYGKQDMKAGGWSARIFANIPFTPALNNKPALNFFGEEIHQVRGGPMGELMPLVFHRISLVEKDDPQMRFMANMGANYLSTPRRFKDGRKLMEDYDFMRDWAKKSGAELRKWLTPEKMEQYERRKKADKEEAESDFDKDVRKVRLRVLKKYPQVQF